MARNRTSALAAGTTVVASDIPGLRESTGVNAVLLPAEDIETWVSEIDDLLKDGKKRQEISIKGKDWARRFAWENKAKEYGSCLEKVRQDFEKRTG